MSARNKLVLYLGLFLILILCFWFFLFRGTDNWKSKLPVIAYVQPFAFINQSGDTVTKQSLAGNVYVANYFFCNLPWHLPEYERQHEKTLPRV